MSEPKIGTSLRMPTAPRLGGGRLGMIDPAAIAKAEAALASLSGNFVQWLNDEIAKLETAREVVQTEGQTAEAMESLYMRAHDLKGLGATYGFPLITKIAGLLCRIIDDKAKRASASLAAVDAHIAAIKTAAREDIKSEDHPLAPAMLADLERYAAG